mmetsp:Transcript_45361/g.176226  ORF Transcript_45361/g.176226 Transcript_45361/m.176226 type:complete len:123 (+) Transcript_45361:2426-2794(+)
MVRLIDRKKSRDSIGAEQIDAPSFLDRPERIENSLRIISIATFHCEAFRQSDLQVGLPKAPNTAPARKIVQLVNGKGRRVECLVAGYMIARRELFNPFFFFGLACDSHIFAIWTLKLKRQNI